MKHHFIHLSRHPSVHPSGHPSVLSWFVYSNRMEKEWNTNAARWRKQSPVIISGKTLQDMAPLLLTATMRKKTCESIPLWQNLWFGTKLRNGIMNEDEHQSSMNLLNA